VRLRGTHCFATGDFVDYLTAFADANGRQMFITTYEPARVPIRAEGDAPAAEGYSGYIIAGLALFTDDSIPLQGTTENMQIIVARPETILLSEARRSPTASRRPWQGSWRQSWAFAPTSPPSCGSKKVSR
jgi:hypothetical protein